MWYGVPNFFSSSPEEYRAPKNIPTYSQPLIVNKHKNDGEATEEVKFSEKTKALTSGTSHFLGIPGKSYCTYARLPSIHPGGTQ